MGTALLPGFWRARYGEELEDLIVGMHEEKRVQLGVYTDVIRAGVRERLSAARLALGDPAGRPPENRARAGAIAVMWGWAGFILAGMVVAKSSEHWQQALPGSHLGASAMYVVLIAAAVLAAVLMLVGLATAAPAFLSDLHTGAWSGLRARAVAAVALTALFGAATLGLVAWAHSLTSVQRNGGDYGYSVGFVLWAALASSTLLVWTATAARAGRHLSLKPATVRTQTWIATGVAALMAVMSAATIGWYIVLARESPAALTGDASTEHPSPVVVSLIAAIVLMILMTVHSLIAARRAITALPELD
jgi:hypothetical protein